MTALLAFLLTASLSAQPGPPEPALRPVPATAAGAAHPVSVSFETDPRHDLVLGPAAQRGPAAGKFTPAVGRPRAEFARFSGHPAVLRLNSELSRHGGGELTEVFLLLSPPPELTAPGDRDGSRRAAAFEDLLKEARSFAKDARFDRFYKNNAAVYAGLAEEGRREAQRGLRPDSVAAYLRRDDAGRHRFIVSPLLPPAMAANLETGTESSPQHLRVRAAEYGKSSELSFDLFGSGAAHEVAHDMLDQLTLGRPELDAYSDLMYDGCAGNWNGCVLEHVDLAVTVRALAAERGEAVAAEMLAAYAPKYPYLKALCGRLAEWEKRKDGSFADFYPRLITVFREALAAKASAPGAKPTRRRRPR